MKTYSKILGIASTLSLVVFIGFLFYAFIFDNAGNSMDRSDVILLGLFLFGSYCILHFVIIHRFGFSLNSEYAPNQKNAILIMSTVIFCFFLVFMTKITIDSYKASIKASSEEKILQTELITYADMKDFGSDTTAYGYVGKLKTKYVDRKLFYILNVQSKIPFIPHLVGFVIQFLDKDGFLLNEIEITNYSQLLKNGDIKGIESNSNFEMNLDIYKRIDKWALLVKTKK